MIRTIVIEDECKTRESLLYLIDKYCPDISVCGTASTFEEGYNLVSGQKPDLLFMDIQLNSVEGTGIDLVQMLDKYTRAVIFISGWKEFAVDAFRVKATDYLLKPVNITQLMEAVHKVREQILDQRADLPPVADTLHIPTQQGFMIIRQHQIIRCRAEGPYTHFYVGDRKFTSSLNLGQVELKLRKDLFFRIHKSHIVNRNHIVEYQRGEGGLARMSDRFEVPVARSQKEAFLSWLS